MALVFAAVAFAQLLDLVTLVVMVGAVGPEAEANPLVSTLLAGWGLPSLAAAKVALIALVSATTLVLASGRHRHVGRLLAGVVALVAVVAGVVGGLSNVRAIAW